VQAVEVSALEAVLGSLDGITVGSLSSWSYTTIFADIAQRGGTVVPLAFPLGSNDLSGIDVLVVDDLVAGAAANDVDLIRDWVYSGGGLLLQGDNSGSVSKINSILAGSGISEYYVGFSNRTLTDFEPHPINDGVSVLYPSDAGLFCTLDGDAAPLVRDASGNVFAAVSAYGSGRVVAAGNEILGSQDLTGDGRLFANQVVDWLASHVVWVSVLPTSGTVSTGATEMVEVHFESSGLDEGIYAAQITFSSNDPDQPESIVSVEMEVVGPPVLSVMLPTAVTEDSGVLPTGGMVYLSRPSISNTVVDLISDDLSELIVSSNVTIQAGQTNATFAITAVDDGLLDGSVIVTVSASAEDHISGAASVFVYDNETATLSLSLPSITSEGLGSVGGAVMIDAIPSEDVVVTLISDDLTEVVSTNVVVPAGLNIALFDLAIVDDDLIDGVQAVTITAHVENWTNGASVLSVYDNESTSLSLDLPTVATEGDGVLTNAGVVSAAGIVTTNTLISLICSDTSEATVPATVTIPQGQSNITFDITTVDDSETDGTQSLSIVGTATGFIPCVDTMTVADNDLHHFTFGTIDTQQVAGVSFNVGITAETIDNQTINAFTGTVSLGASGDIGSVAMTPTESGVFSGGQWSGDVTALDISDNVVLVADDGAGHSDTSTVFDVTGSRIVITPASLTNTLVVAGQTAVRNMVISNAGNADLTFSIRGAGSLPDEGLIAYYPFNGNADDESGNGYDGTVNGATLTTNRFGDADSAYHFDGNDDIELTDFSVPETFSISLWVDPASIDISQCIIGKHSSSGDNLFVFGLWDGDNSNGGINKEYHVRIRSASVDLVAATQGIQHLVVVVEKTSFAESEISVYKDGAQIYQSILNDVIGDLSGKGWVIGQDWDGGLKTDFFQGDIDDVRIYDRALSAAEIQNLYNEGDDGLLADDSADNAENNASAGDTILFSDDFEDGDFDGWSGVTSRASVVDDVVAEGAFSLLIDSGVNSHYSGLLQEFDDLQPERISFLWRSEDPETGSGHTVFGGDDADSTQG